MRYCRKLILPIALAAAPAQATQVCAWMDESIEPYEEEAPADDAANSFDSIEAAADAAAWADAAAAATEVDAGQTEEVMKADRETAEAAAAAAQAAAEAAAPEASDAAASAADVAVESEPAEGGLLNLKLWLEADGDASFYYKMAGEGLVQDEGGHAHAPNSGTYVLSRGEPSSPWGLGMTFYPPGRVDVILEVRAFPEDIFSEEDPPLLATFTFARRIPAGETQPPATLAARQCQDITFPPRKDRFAD